MRDREHAFFNAKYNGNNNNHSPAKIIIIKKKTQQTTKHRKHYVSIHFSVGFFSRLNMIYMMNVSRRGFPTKKTEIVEQKLQQTKRIENEKRSSTHTKKFAFEQYRNPFTPLMSGSTLIPAHIFCFFDVCVTFDGYYYYFWWKLAKKKISKNLAQPFNLDCKWRKIKAFQTWLKLTAWRRRTFICNTNNTGGVCFERA